MTAEQRERADQLEWSQFVWMRLLGLPSGLRSNIFGWHGLEGHICDWPTARNVVTAMAEYWRERRFYLEATEVSVEELNLIHDFALGEFLSLLELANLRTELVEVRADCEIARREAEKLKGAN